MSYRQASRGASHGLSVVQTRPLWFTVEAPFPAPLMLSAFSFDAVCAAALLDDVIGSRMIGNQWVDVCGRVVGGRMEMGCIDDVSSSASHRP